MLRQAPLVPEESCVIVIDMQNFNGDRNGAEGKALTGPENDYYWENLENRATPNIAKLLKSARAKGIEVIIYEPLIKESEFFKSKLVDLITLKSESDVIITNRMHDDLNDVQDKVFTRDLFQEN